MFKLHPFFNTLIYLNLLNFRYYLSSEDGKPGQRHLFVVQDPSTDDARRLESHCITCDLTEFLWSSRYLYGNCTHFNALVNYFY